MVNLLNNRILYFFEGVPTYSFLECPNCQWFFHSR